MSVWQKLRKFLAECLWSSPEGTTKPTAEISLEELRKFLPTFLSHGSETAFLEEIQHFLGSGTSRPFYSLKLRHEPFIFQGDGLEGMLIVNLPDTSARPGGAMVLSNSCDIAPSNERLFSASLCYAPILSFPAYLTALRKTFTKDAVDNHERAVRRQSITQIFFLPQDGRLRNDAIVFLDRIISVANDTIDRRNLSERRIFTLSDFGAWLLTLKLSIHLCRIRDKVDRTAGVVA